MEVNEYISKLREENVKLRAILAWYIDKYGYPEIDGVDIEENLLKEIREVETGNEKSEEQLKFEERVLKTLYHFLFIQISDFQELLNILQKNVHSSQKAIENIKTHIINNKMNK